MRASVVVLSAGVVCVLGVSFNATQTVPASVLAYLGPNIELHVGTHLRRAGITKPYIFHVVLAPECVLNVRNHHIPSYPGGRGTTLGTIIFTHMPSVSCKDSFPEARSLNESWMD